MNKYGAKKTWYLDGQFIPHKSSDKAFLKMMKGKGALLFDSKAESRWYPNLLLLEKAGDIHDIDLQPKYKFILDGVYTGITYKGDYRFYEQGQEVCMDVKGMETPVFKLKKKLMKAFYPDVELRIVK